MLSPTVHGLTSATIPQLRAVRAPLARSSAAFWRSAPGGVGHDAFELARQVDPGLVADAEPARLALDHAAVAVGALADFEEVGVGGDLQRLHQPDRAEFGLAGVAERLRRDVDALAGAEAFDGLMTPASSAAHRGDRLERRARRIGAVDGAVGERPGRRCRCPAARRIRPGSAVWRTCSGRSSGRSRSPAPGRCAGPSRRTRRRRPVCRPRGPLDALQQRPFALPLQAEVERHLEAVAGDRGRGASLVATGLPDASTATRSTPVRPRR